jgi:hypothetical protein
MKTVNTDILLNKNDFYELLIKFYLKITFASHLNIPNL